MDAIAAQPLTSENDSCPQCGHEVGDAWLVCAWCGQQLAAPAELAEGTRLADGRYQILKVIGRGGFGITYDVGDRRLERRVAMKELFPESAVRHGSMVLTPPAGRPSFKAARERFLREARVLARTVTVRPEVASPPPRLPTFANRLLSSTSSTPWFMIPPPPSPATFDRREHPATDNHRRRGRLGLRR